jgi:hypothetical protein
LSEGVAAIARLRGSAAVVKNALRGFQKGVSMSGSGMDDHAKLAEAEILFDYTEMTGRTQSNILREFIRSLDVRKKRTAPKTNQGVIS